MSVLTSRPRSVGRAAIALVARLSRALSPIFGIGVLGVLGPAAALAGSALPVAVLIAAVPAICGAWAAAFLAREYPGPGAAYRCGRDRLGRFPGWLAASAELLTRVAIIAAAAWVFASASTPTMGRGVALVLIIGLTAAAAAELFGGGRSRWIGAIAAGVIVISVIALAYGVAPVEQATGSRGGHGVFGVMSAAAAVFLVYVGVDRAASAPPRELPGGDASSETVRAMAGTVSTRRAWMVSAVAIVIGAIVLMGFSRALLRQLGVERLAVSPAPVRDFLAAADAGGLTVALTAVVAVVACSVIGTQFIAFRGVIEAVVAEGDLPRRAGVWWIGFTGLLASVIVLTTTSTTAVLLAAGLALADTALLSAAARARSASTFCVACVGIVTSVPLLTSLSPWIMLVTVAMVLAGAAAIWLVDRVTRRPAT